MCKRRRARSVLWFISECLIFNISLSKKTNLISLNLSLTLSLFDPICQTISLLLYQFIIPHYFTIEISQCCIGHNHLTFLNHAGNAELSGQSLITRQACRNDLSKSVSKNNI